jgi:hypothetical protein
LAKAAAAAVVPAAAATAIVRLWLLPEGAPSGVSPGFPDPSTGVAFDLGEAGAALGGTLLIVVSSVVAANLVTAASFSTVSGALVGGRPRWQASLRFAWTWLASLTWLGLVTGLLGSLALLALVVPGVYLLVAWSVAVPVLLAEGRRGGNALTRSRQLVGGRWWPTLVVALAGAVPVVVYAGLSFLAVSVLARATTDALVLEIGQAVVDLVRGVVVLPFVIAVNTVLYFDLRFRQEDRHRVRQEPVGGEDEPPIDVPQGAPLSPPGTEPEPATAPGSTFGSVPAYDLAHRRRSVAGSPPTTSSDAPSIERLAGDEPTAVTAVPAYDPSARRTGSFGVSAAGGTAAEVSPQSPGASRAWGGGHEVYATTRGRQEDMRMRVVVAGVFVGMWLFVISAIVLAVVFGRTTLDSLRIAPAPTSTVPTVPVPTSTP